MAEVWDGFDERLDVWLSVEHPVRNEADPPCQLFLFLDVEEKEDDDRTHAWRISLLRCA